MLRGSSILLLWVLILGLTASASDVWAGSAKGIKTITQAQPSESDQALTKAVQAFLKDDVSLQPSLTDLQLKTVDGIVYAKGTVASEAEKAAIEARIHACPGVQTLQSYIKVIR